MSSNTPVGLGRQRGLLALLLLLVAACASRTYTLPTHVIWNDVNAVRAKLAAGVDPDETSAGAPNTGLIEAISNGNLEIARILLDAGADPDSVSTVGLRPLTIALVKKNPHAVELLVKAGASVNTRDRHGNTPLHEAAMQGPLRSVELLLQAHADTEVTDSAHRTPLDRAAASGRADIVDHLLKHGANVWPERTREENVLHMIGQFSRVNREADVERVARLLLEEATRQGVASQMLRQGAGGWSPLHKAVAAGNAMVVKALLSYGANPNAVLTNPEGLGWTPLHHAAEKGRQDLLQLLIAHGANPKLRTASGVTAEQLFLQYQQADAQKRAAERQRAASVEKQEQGGFQWGKLIAMTAAVTPLALEGVDSQTQLEVFTGIIKDSAPNAQGMNNLRAAADNHSVRNQPAPSQPTHNSPGGLVVSPVVSSDSQPAAVASKEAPGVAHCMMIRNTAEATTGRGALYFSQSVSFDRVQWNAVQDSVRSNFEREIKAMYPKAVGPKLCMFSTNKSQQQSLIEDHKRAHPNHEYIYTSIVPRG